MAKISNDPSVGYYISHSLGGSGIEQLPSVTELNARLVDPVTGKTVTDAIQVYVSGLEQNNGKVSDIAQTADFVIARAEAYNNFANGGTNEAAAGINSAVINKLNTVTPMSGTPWDGSNPTGNYPGTKQEALAESSIGEFWNAQKKRETVGGYQETVGGSDMAVFFMAEVPNVSDLADGISVEDCRKEFIILEMDNVLSLQYSIMRGVFPVRQLGHENPVDFTRGPRTMAGFMACSIFAEDVLGRLRSRVLESFEKLFGNLRKINTSNESTSYLEDNSDSPYASIETERALASNFKNVNAERDAYRLYRYYDAALKFDQVELLDQLPSFHLLIIGVNETGKLVKFILKGVQIMEENQVQGTRRPDIMNKISFVCKDIVPMSNAGPSTAITSSMEGGSMSTEWKMKSFTASQALGKSLRRE
jgi:hypothetical protein